MNDPVILSLGSVNADFQVRTERPLEAGETLSASDFVRLGGGKAANVAFLAHRLGCRTVLLARLGDDDLREQALAPLRRAGIALDHVTMAPGTPTAFSMIAVPPDGKKSIVLAGNANDAWDEAAIAAAVKAVNAAPAGSILAADYEVTPDAAARAIEAAHQRGLRVVLDPAPAARADSKVLALAYALTPDAREAAEITGIDTGTARGAAKAALALRGMGAALACVKLSDGGCVLAHEDAVSLIPAVEVEVVDATGAGDAFTGALAVALFEGQPPPQAALFATAAAHLAVTGYGSQESYPDRAGIEAFLPRLALRPAPR